jgi:hypothetical protein
MVFTSRLPCARSVNNQNMCGSCSAGLFSRELRCLRLNTDPASHWCHLRWNRCVFSRAELRSASVASRALAPR